MSICRRHFGANHAEIAVVLNNLGSLLQASGRPERAEEYHRGALRVKRRVLAGAHPDLALTMNNLATLLCAQGRPSGARQWFRKALQLANDSLGISHPVTRSIGANHDRLRVCV